MTTATPDQTCADLKALRRMLWLRHGCAGLYGDDGEMQCGKCLIDFRRDPVIQIERRFLEIGHQTLRGAEAMRRFAEQRSARALAEIVHAQQKYGNRPYLNHLADVVGVLGEYGFSDDSALMAAAWLHDAIEDTAATPVQIATLISPEVADLVWAVTDEPGDTRHARKLATYPKIRNTPHSVALKLADRIANVRASSKSRPKLDIYREEHLEFRRALWREGEFVDMWAELYATLGGGS